jgi:hypothetical protein
VRSSFSKLLINNFTMMSMSTRLADAMFLFVAEGLPRFYNSFFISYTPLVVRG